ncbi:MAG: FHA domain-containing protein [Candidatus Ancillula sp.]|jgi:pSer/pThr/pTyr-binding forkhead associated (FHA) protein|nr:FHA domain-containing protein [Candidatus Ancillula sp.]
MLSESTNIGIPRIIDPTIDVPMLGSEDVEAIAGLDSNDALLIVFRPQTGERYLLKDDLITVGRDKSSDIFFDDPSVSRKHALIRRKGNKFYIKDVGSLNGTYINHNIQDEEIELHRGDEIQIGKYRLLFFPAANIQD